MPCSRRIGVPRRKRASGVTSRRSIAERRPVALGVLDQLVGLRDPHRASAALQPVVEKDAGDLAALPAPVPSPSIQPRPEANGVLGTIGRGRDEVEGLVDHPRSGEMARGGPRRHR